MGLAAAYERRGEYARAVGTYTGILTSYNWYLPAACEQARVFSKAGDWDNATETVSRVLDVDPTNVECLRLLCLHSLLREGAGLRAVSRLQGLLDALARQEPRNARLHYDISRVFARLSGRAPTLLSVTLAMLDVAVKADPDCAVYACELGAQRLLAGDLAGAAAAYRDAGRVDEGSADAVPGMIAVQVAQVRVPTGACAIHTLTPPTHPPPPPPPTPNAGPAGGRGGAAGDVPHHCGGGGREERGGGAAGGPAGVAEGARPAARAAVPG